MKILILANQDIASLLAVNLVLAKIPKHQYKILLSAAVGKTAPKPQALEHLRFAEQDLFFKLLLPTGADLNNPFSSSKLHSFDVISKQGIRVEKCDNINAPHWLASLSKWQPELIISIRFGQILQPPIIAIPPFGVINLHSGPLPDFRGVMATFWAMLNGRQEIATTLHFIDSNKIDAGGIISIQKQPLDKQKCYLSNVLSLYPPGVDAIEQCVLSLQQGQSVNTYAPDLESGAYYSFPSLADLRAFEDKGFKLVDYPALMSLFASS